MSDVKWIKIVTDIFDNKKIRMIESMPDGDSIIVIWLKILILAGNINDSGYMYFTKDIPYTEQMLATIFNRPLTTVQLALDTFEKFGMIEIVDDIIHVSNWEKYQNVEGMEKIREQTRKRVERYRERKKLECNVTSNDTVTQSNAPRIDIDIEEDINNNICSKSQHQKEVDELFESLWKLYIRKEGKSQVKKASKEKMFAIGFDKMKECIEKYAAGKQGCDKQYILMGSTFFNGRYEDYLKPEEKEKDVPMVKNQNEGLDKVVSLEDDDSNSQEWEEDRKKHPFNDGWRINDDGYWVKVNV